MMFQVILCTCPSRDVASLIAKTLVTKKLAACVNIIPNVTSVYTWEDELQFDDELQLVIKATSDLFSGISAKIHELHPYETPEIIAMNIQQGDDNYLHWINESTKSVL